MKRLIFNLLPNSLIEKLKLKYYNAKNSKYFFALQKDLYVTRANDSWEVVTKKPLYFIVKDIDIYEKYYSIKLNDVVIDAGANEGVFSVVYSQKIGDNGKVFAFEPDSINIEILRCNMSLNKKHNNIVVVEKALWQKEDIIEFFESGSVASSVFHENKNSKKISIKATSLDSFVENTNLKRLNFIKMDIEGAEVEALEGAVKTISKFKPNFAIASYHIVNNKQTYIAVEDFFKRYDYPYKTEFFNNGEIMTYAGNSVK